MGKAETVKKVKTIGDVDEMHGEVWKADVARKFNRQIQPQLDFLTIVHRKETRGKTKETQFRRRSATRILAQRKPLAY